MNNPRQITILGAGLAGSMAAALFLRDGYRVTLIDHPQENTATRVAAGLFNVITGRSMVLTWKAAELLGAMDDFFSDPFFLPLQKFLHHQTIYFPFKTPKQRNDWSGLRSNAPELDFAELVSEPRLPDEIENPLGGINIHHCGWMETENLCKAIAQMITHSENGKFITAKVDYNNIDPVNGILTLNDETIHFDELIFCEGVAVLQNPFFEGLPIRPLKGQLLEIEIENFDPGFIITRGVFLLPIGNSGFLAGSTYEPVFSDPYADELGRTEIEFVLRGTLKLPWKVTNQRAGIRPSTPDRRPIIGSHPKYHNIHLINGLGAKGVLHSAWCARQLKEKIEGILPEIEKESALVRYIDKLRNLIN